MIFSRSDLPGLHGVIRDCTIPKGLAKLSEGDIAVINTTELSRDFAQRLVDIKVAAVVNVDKFYSPLVPYFGPHILLEASIPVYENAGTEFLSLVKNSKKGRIHENELFYGENSIGKFTTFTTEEATIRFDSAREALADHIDAMTGNTVEFVRTEAPLIIDGIGVPQLDFDFEDRKVLVVSPTSDTEQQIKDLRFFIREYEPSIIAVGEAADTLLSLGHQPRVIVGDPSVISEKALRSEAAVIIPAAADGHAPGLSTIQDLGISAMTFPAGSDSPTDLAILLAYFHHASLIVSIGDTMDLDRLFSEDPHNQLPSALLTRLRAGQKIVDASSVAELYRVHGSAGGWLWAMLSLLVALAVVVAIIGFSGDQDFLVNLIEAWNSLALRFQSLFQK